MKRSVAVLLLAVFLLSGCSYAPGLEGPTFWIPPANVPDFPMDEYYASVKKPELSENREPIEAPVVNLESLPARVDTDFVNVRDYIPDIVVDLRYATEENFTSRKIYDFTDVYLRYGTVVKLMQVQQDLRQHGLLLKIWDGFRPTSAQHALWSAYPDPNYVANPKDGYSSHSKGNTLDVTLVDIYGVEAEMPTGYDDFSAKADRNYSDCSELAAYNAILLENTMGKYGFEGYQNEWWHFTDEADYAVEECFDPGEIAIWYAECKEYINLRVAPDVNAEVLAPIPAKEQFTLLGWDGPFAYVEYQGKRGYVNADFIKKVE